MNENLYKRLEEAAEVLYPYEKYKDGLTEKLYNEVITLLRKAHLAGVEYGYNEAIAQAKEWLSNNIHSDMTIGSFFESRESTIADFESDMNKLWEEMK